MCLLVPRVRSKAYGDSIYAHEVNHHVIRGQDDIIGEEQVIIVCSMDVGKCWE